MSEKRRVVVTGMGILTGLGSGVETTWESLVSGRAAVRTVEAFVAAGCRTTVAAAIADSLIQDGMDALGVKHVDRTVDMGLLAADAALRSAGFADGTAQDPLPVGTLFGTGMGCAYTAFENYRAYFDKGIKGVRPTAIPRCMMNSLTCQISMKYHLTGPNYVTVSACGSSTISIGIAFRMIRDGYADAVLVGGSEAALEPGMFGAWDRLGIMSHNSDPSVACRPFDSDRDGCVFGEGAGALVLEEYGSAMARRARIEAEIIGYGESSDAMYLTAPHQDGQAKAMKMALDCAGLAPDSIGFVHAHGTGTRANDVCECQSVRMVLGDAADAIPVISTKSYHGHLLGASGVVETIAVIQCLQNGKIPGNLNLNNPDPECNVCLAGKQPADISSAVAMKNSFGFGGNNSVVVLSKWQG